MSDPYEDSLLQSDACLRDAIKAIDHSRHKMALVVDDDRRLLGTITDGDVRRALLAGSDMDTSATSIMFTEPVTAREDTLTTSIEAARRRNLVKLPLLDSENRIIGIHVIEDAGAEPNAENIVVLMAGGLGKRLRPLTNDAPKPLLDVGEKPLIETIVDRLVENGFRKIYFAVRYKAEMVEEHFGDGSRWAADFQYIHEPAPLGTAGALGLLPERPDKPFIVMNADLLTKIDLRQLLDFHDDSSSAATMAVRAYDFEIPYGVVSTEGHRITGIEEKPVQQIFVNAGIYVINPETLDLVKPDEHLDMPDLFNALIEGGLHTAAFPIREYWIDVGRMEDYRRANDEFEDEFG